LKGVFKVFGREKAQARLDELQERLEKLERDMRALQLEWESTYDKVRQMMGRIAKRAEMLHEAAEDQGKLYPTNGTAEELPETPGLTPAQARAQAQVMARRHQLRKEN
jgi:predicted nuclease with TOPRIM domain